MQIDVTVNAGAKEFAGETSFTSGTTFTITCNRTGFVSRSHHILFTILEDHYQVKRYLLLSKALKCAICRLSSPFIQAVRKMLFMNSILE